MAKPNRKAQLLDGAQRVIYTAELPRSMSVLQDLETLLKANIPTHYRLVTVDRNHKGDVILRYRLKAKHRKSRAKKPAPVQVTAQVQEPAIHIPRGQLRQRTAVLTLPDGQRREATPDLTASTNPINHRRWFRAQFADELAAHPDHKLALSPKINGHIVLEGALVAPEPIELRPRNVATRPARIKPPKVSEPAQATPGTLARKARRTDYQAKAVTKKAKPRKPPAAKARSNYTAPQPRQRAKAAEATTTNGFNFTVIHCLCSVVKGETFVRYMYNNEVVQVPNTRQRTLREAAKATLPEESLAKVLAFHPARGTTNLLLVLHDAKRVPHRGLDLLEVAKYLGNTNPIYTALTAAKAAIYRLAYGHLTGAGASLIAPPTKPTAQSATL